MKESLKLKEINARMMQSRHPGVLGVKCFKLHYAIGRNFKKYQDLISHLDPLNLTQEEQKQLNELLGVGKRYTFDQVLKKCEDAGLKEIADKQRLLVEGMEEVVEVETYKIPAEILPQDMDGHTYTQLAWIITEEAQNVESPIPAPDNSLQFPDKPAN
jgi:hypothetical protein